MTEAACQLSSAQGVFELLESESTVNQAPPIIVDDSCFPVVLTIFPARVDERSIAAYFKQFGSILDRGQPFVSVADATLATERPPPTVRKQLADWTHSIEPRLVHLSKGDARVVQSSLIRGAMTAIGWLHRTPVPQEWFTSMAGATEWALARLDEAAVDVPPLVRQRVQRIAAASSRPNDLPLP